MHTMDAHASSTSQPARVVRLLLGDQLNAAHTWWQSPDPDVLTVLMECRQETDYARHHVQKVLAFFLAMRSFAKERIAESTACTTRSSMIQTLLAPCLTSCATSSRFALPKCGFNA